MVRTYRRRRTGLRSSGTLRRRRFARRVRAGPSARRFGRSRGRFVRASRRTNRRELKQLSATFGINATNGFPTTGFNWLYPNDLATGGVSPTSTNWVGTSNQSPCGIWYPSQGTGSDQRIGNNICVKGLMLNLNFFTGTSGIRYRFVLFKWKAPTSPDLLSANWFQPCGIGNGGFGSGWNCDVPARDNDFIKVIYQSTWRSRLSTDEGNVLTSQDTEGAATTAVSWYRHKVHKFFKFNYILPVENQFQVPSNVETAVEGPTTTLIETAPGYKGRLFWCVVTDYDATREPNDGATIHGVSGIVRFYYTDP